MTEIIKPQNIHLPYSVKAQLNVVKQKDLFLKKTGVKISRRKAAALLL